MTAHSLSGTSRAIFAPKSKFSLGRFRHMFSLDAWQPKGSSEADQLDDIAALASRSFETADADASFDNPAIPAGYTYFGQFIDHDITFEPLSSLQRAADVEALANFRTPCFDLDSVYGRGPDDQPFLYERANKARLLTAANEQGEPDLARNSDASTDTASTDGFSLRRTALIGDMRNDENIIVSQLQLAIIRLHNAFVDDGKRFEEAQRLTRWHYQWVVIHDFVKRLCGAEIVDHVLGADNGFESPNLRFYKPGETPFIPVEFAGAAYRLGHSMVRPSYHLNDTLEGFRGGQPLSIFGPAIPFSVSDTPAEHLNGSRVLPSFWTIQWNRFVEHAGSSPQLSRRLDRTIAPQLMSLPIDPAGPERLRSLAFRNLVRGWRLGLPSGQDVARATQIEVPQLSEGSDPLWLYVLKEAELTAQRGLHLGPLAGRLVAEVFVGILACDSNSFYARQPGWKPELSSNGANFELADLLRHSGAPMTADEANAVMNPGP